MSFRWPRMRAASTNSTTPLSLSILDGRSTVTGPLGTSSTLRGRNRSVSTPAPSIRWVRDLVASPRSITCWRASRFSTWT